MRRTDRQIWDRLEKMLEDGINGTFEESDYDETRLSKLETKWLRYLTASKLSRQRIERDRQTMQELVSDISHQTKTPLANILLYAELLEEQNPDGPNHRLSRQLRQQSEKLAFLIEALVKLSRLEAGTVQLSPATHGLSALLEESILQVTPKAEDKRLRIVCEPTDRTARFDPIWTQEALCNILDNAVKYSPAGGTIAVRVKPLELFVAIEVSDQGIGIPEEELPLVFGRFYRGRGIRDESGVGIGLYLSRAIVEEEGGYLAVQSQPGVGSTFSMFLQY